MPNSVRTTGSGWRVIDRRAVLRTGLVGAAGFAAPALLAGCGSGKQPLTFWNFYGPQTQSDPTVKGQSDWFTATVAAWNTSHQQQVQATYVPGAVYLNGAKLPTAFAAGDGPDIFLISPGDFLRYYNGGVLTDLTDHMTAAARADFFPDALATRTVNGRIYGLPMEVEPLAMFYSPRTWERVGLSEGDIPTTWDQLLTVGRKLASPSRAGLVLEVTPGYYQNFTWYPWMWQGGGAITDGNRVTFDSAPTRAALELFATVTSAGIGPRTLPASGDLVSAFTADQAGMWESGIWNVATFRLNAPQTSYDLFRLPTPTSGHYTTTLGGWSFVANARGRNPEAAAEFCVWALGSMEEASITRMVDWCTKAKSDIAPRRSALAAGERAGAYDTPVMKKFKDEIFPGGRGEPRVPPVVYKAVSDAIQQVQLGGRSPASTAQTAADEIGAYMNTYQGAALV